MGISAGEMGWQGAGAWHDQLQRIAQDPDPGHRNRLITRMYFDLARCMDTVLGQQDANWLTFGTWASHTAGTFIRGEQGPVSWGAKHVADGNIAIIEDVAPCFVAYLSSIAGTPEERSHPLVEMGQSRIDANEHLADAFDCYERARERGMDPADELRAQLILRANVGVAHHEQWLADRFVDAAMPLGGLFGIVTTRFVSLDLPNCRLDLCEPVPPPAYLGGAMWPSALDRLQDDHLVRLYARIGHTPDDVEESAARSWEDFDERMGYIAMFFRAYQRDPDLHTSPESTADQH